MEKECSTCHQELSFDNFYKKSDSKDGLSPHCKSCKKIKDKSYYLLNKDVIKTRVRLYEKQNQDVVKVRTKRYRQKNKKELNLKRNIYRKSRYKIDPAYKIKRNVCKRIWNGLMGISKQASSMKLLGCDFIFFKQYLESQFIIGMTWQNYGRVWEIDHIKPIASFNLINSDEQFKCLNYLNQRPLWKTTQIARQFGDMISIGNLEKGGKI
jgi:hypothetical protein